MVLSMGDLRSTFEQRPDKPIGKSFIGKGLSGIIREWERELSCWIVGNGNRKKPGFVLDGTRVDIEKDPEIGKLYFTENQV